MTDPQLRGVILRCEADLPPFGSHELPDRIEDYLRQRGLAQWAPEHPALARFKQRRCSSEDEFAAWVAEERNRAEHEPKRTHTGGANGVARFDEIAANGLLSLLNLLDYLLKRQIEAQARAFATEGGFTERLYRTRTKHRDKKKRP